MLTYGNLRQPSLPYRLTETVFPCFYTAIRGAFLAYAEGL